MKTIKLFLLAVIVFTASLAVAQNDIAVLSVFVNPAQFAPNEDYDQYPRTFDADRAMAQELGMTAIYAPTPQAMYPDGYSTYVDVKGLGDVLCGATRLIDNVRFTP